MTDRGCRTKQNPREAQEVIKPISTENPKACISTEDVGEREGRRGGVSERGRRRSSVWLLVEVVVVVEATRRNCTNEGTTRRQPGGSSRTSIASCRTTSTLLIDMWNNTRIDVRIVRKK